MNKWIPVSEKLPKNYDDVLICDGYNITIGWYEVKTNRWATSDEEWQSGFYDDTARGVIAWQPLPEPYKEDSDV